MEFYLLNYFKPGTNKQTENVLRGRGLFHQIGCASCHKPDLEIKNDRRVADVETVYDPVNGVFNRLFATATPLFDATDDGSGFPAIKTPQGNRFLVRNFFADLKRHDLGPELHERNFDGTMQKEFMTEALGGVGSTPSYGHDGRSIDLMEIILRHGGEASSVRGRFKRLEDREQLYVLEFLRSLVLFGPPDTASNLGPANRAHPDFPQRGHGSIDLAPLFNDPTDKE